MTTGRRPVLLLTAIGALTGLALAGCGGDDTTSSTQSPAALPSGVTSATAATTAADAAEYTSQAQELATRLSKLDSLNDYEEYTATSEDLATVVVDWATQAGASGIGSVACEVMPLQLSAVSNATASDQALLMGLNWLAPVKAAKADELAIDVPFEDVQLDAQMKTACPDVRQEVLDATEVADIDDLWDATQQSGTAS